MKLVVLVDNSVPVDHGAEVAVAETAVGDSASIVTAVEVADVADVVVAAIAAVAAVAVVAVVDAIIFAFAIAVDE